nr:MAG TPA: hypothetical protein [Caudoviricetes sp.]
MNGYGSNLIESRLHSRNEPLLTEYLIFIHLKSNIVNRPIIFTTRYTPYINVLYMLNIFEHR